MLVCVCVCVCVCEKVTERVRKRRTEVMKPVRKHTSTAEVSRLVAQVNPLTPSHPDASSRTHTHTHTHIYPHISHFYCYLVCCS